LTYLGRAAARAWQLREFEWKGRSWDWICLQNSDGGLLVSSANLQSGPDSSGVQGPYLIKDARIDASLLERETMRVGICRVQVAAYRDQAVAVGVLRHLRLSLASAPHLSAEHRG
jgi:hypothetical protein